MKSSLFLLFFVPALLLSQALTTVRSQYCNPAELSPCLGSITGGAPPTKGCCYQLRKQQPCFCGYMRNPSLKGYISSGNAKKVASTCGVSLPKC